MNVLQDLNPDQKKAVTHGRGPLLIVAGAGTGKTTVITRRIAWLILRQKLKADEVLALTFTEKAAEEMETRVDKLLPLGYEDLWIQTFHEFGKRVLEANALEIGLDPRFKILTQADQYLFLRQHLFEFDLDYYRPLGNPTRFIQALAKFFSRLKDEEIDEGEFLRYAREKFKIQNPKFKGNSKLACASKSKIQNEAEQEEAQKLIELAEAYGKYQEMMRQESYVDFGDLIMCTLWLFRRRKSVLARYQKQFKYILVDEFQDTNFAQYQLLRLLAAKNDNLNVVGDDDQSIYRFRGAALNNILNFKKHCPRAREVVLTTNYRSLPGILGAAYDLIQGNNPDRLETKLKIQKRLRVGRKIKKADFTCRPVLIWEATVEREARAVAQEIVRLKKEEKRDWRDFAILVRANDHAEPFVKVLERHNLPYLFVASKGLYTTPEVLGLIAYLKTLNNFLDSPSLYRVTHLPVFDFAPQDVIRLLNYARRKSISLYEAFDDAEKVAGVGSETKKSVRRLLELLKKQAGSARRKKVSEVLLEFLEESGYLNLLKRQETLAEEQRFLNVAEFFKRIQTFQQTGESHTVKDFVEELELATEGGEDPAPAEIEEGPDTIKVMTVHKAKGLEFPVVFLTSLVEGHFPPQERPEELPIPDDLLEEKLPDELHAQEERRLFYVGLTRAMERLYLTAAEDYGGKRKRKPSRFLKEIEDKIEVRSAEMTSELAGQQPLFTAKVPLPAAVKHQLPPKFSYTQLGAFEKCPLQYKFAHVLKIPTEGSHTFSYGKSLHETLRDFYTVIMAGKIPSETQLLKMLGENWINEWYEGKKHERARYQKARQALKDFYQKNKKTFTPPLYVEKGFNMKIGPYVLKGAIDRVDRLSAGGVEVTDYKTGDSKKGETEIKRPVQLMLYSLALEQIFKLRPERLTLYFIDDNKSYSIDRAKFGPKLADVKTKAIKAFDEITASDFPPRPSRFTCRYCDFRMICPYRR
jgi:DNA helicase-2/ATP-dependent DNA helicase PcrA